jgi:hypothetical protein
MKKIYLVLIILIPFLILAGCKDDKKPNTNPNQDPITEPDPTPPPPPNITDMTPSFPINAGQEKELLMTYTQMIRSAGFFKESDIALNMIANNKIFFVSPPKLPDNFNAWADLGRKEIKLNKPMYDRYPLITHQATIFFHELIHINTGEISHNGPWWSKQDEFAQWCKANYSEISAQSIETKEVGLDFEEKITQ